MTIRKTIGLVAAVAATLGVATSGYAATRSHPARSADASRLDDGKGLLAQSKISEQQAIAAARSAASGSLNEVDLEHRDGKLVWNVDVGDKDVKVDAADGKVVSVDQDD
jgi:uncharacterized membrane protein YkoI